MVTNGHENELNDEKVPGSTRRVGRSLCQICFPYRLRLTLFGRALFLLAFEAVVNISIWTITLILWAPDPQKRSVLSLAVIAWTLGLRHGLDMDHITVIDNVTRSLVALGRKPVTVGFFFSLGHSSLVIGVTVAIIIATSTIDKLPKVAGVGGVVGVSVSASMLFLLALINSVILYKALITRKELRQANKTLFLHESVGEGAERIGDASRENAEKVLETEAASTKITSLDAQTRQFGGDSGGNVPAPALTCMARVVRPLLRLVDEPWKLFPIGVIFSFGFDTSSEIALLGVSALARSGSSSVPTGEIIMLPLLFTAGMTLVDSCDSVFMVYAYTASSDSKAEGKTSWRSKLKVFEQGPVADSHDKSSVPDHSPQPVLRLSSFSIALTAVSIIIALLISIIEFMGLALEKCKSCSEAAANDGGLAGRWWRFWATLNDNSGFLGAGVVGFFVVSVAIWLAYKKFRQSRRKEGTREQVV